MRAHHYQEQPCHSPVHKSLLFLRSQTSALRKNSNNLEHVSVQSFSLFECRHV